MAFLFSPLFSPRKTSHRRSDAALELKVQARSIIQADDDTVVSISERNCGAAGCGGAETIVLIMHPKRPSEAVIIGKPLEQVTASDLSDALARLVAPTGLPELSPKPK